VIWLVGLIALLSAMGCCALGIHLGVGIVACHPERFMAPLCFFLILRLLGGGGWGYRSRGAGAGSDLTFHRRIRGE